MKQLFIGFMTEGSTDTRLLESIILRTFDEIALECRQQIMVINPIISIKKTVGLKFVDTVIECSRLAFDYGAMVLCVHVDADDASDNSVLQTKFLPLSEFILEIHDQNLCRDLVPVVPVYMSEAWMLADKELLKSEIGTEMSDVKLGIQHAPESYSDPKTVIEQAISIARQDMPKRRRNDLRIGELYQPIGQKILLEKLNQLPSYVKFKNNVRDVYRALNYLQ